MNFVINIFIFLSILFFGYSNSICDSLADFKCSNGTCIPIQFQCDGVFDCSDKEDEINCHYLHDCKKGQFICLSGECLSPEARGNGITECSDLSDEKYYTALKNGSSVGPQNPNIINGNEVPEKVWLIGSLAILFILVLITGIVLIRFLRCRPKQSYTIPNVATTTTVPAPSLATI